MSRAFGTTTLDGVVATFRDGLARAAATEPARFDRPGCTVSGEPARRGSGTVAVWGLGRHVLVRADPDLVPRLGGLAGRARTTIDEVADAVAAGFAGRPGSRTGATAVLVLHATGLRRPTPPAGIEVRALDRTRVGAIDASGRLAAIGRRRRWPLDPRFAALRLRTRPTARGAGIGPAVGAALVDAAVRDGYLPQCVAPARDGAGSRGRPGLASSLGFRQVATWVDLEVHPPGSAGGP